MTTSCAACLMPFSKDSGERKNTKYCSYCQSNGQFTFIGTRKEFQAMCYNAMRKSGMGNIKAKFFTWMIRFAPHWKK